jgi:glycosyltransferase involved in cell wall biosynthesis
MKLVVAHNGARRGYAVPAILERSDMLEHFFTDICADVGFGKKICQIGAVLPGMKMIAKLKARRLPPEIVKKTITFTSPNVQHFVRSLWIGSNLRNQYFEHIRWQTVLGHAAADIGFGDARWLHAFMDEFPSLLVAAKQRQLKVVSEIYILLSSDRLLVKERAEFPGWEPSVPNFDILDQQIRPDRPLFTCVDYAICPSEAVRDDAVGNFGFAEERTAIVPYGVSDDWFKLRNEPVPGRILFVGTADLRKGIHYLGMAAHKLALQGFRYEFRIAGEVHKQVRCQEICQGLHFLGRIPRTDISREFASADLLVLPSLAEGSAAVTYEALAAGIPVVTTRASGSVVRDGIEGRIIPERDAESLAAAISEIVEDRAKRGQMEIAARERARQFTWEYYGERLVQALRGFDAHDANRLSGQQ